MAYHRGLRASEVGNLKLADYRPTEGRLYVRRLKGSREGEYLLTPVEQRALRAWLKVRGSQPGPLFLSRNHRAISRRQLDHLMKHYCRLAGISEDKAHMHALKHSCGTHFLALSGDIMATQDHLGHADLGSTQIYAQFTQRERIATSPAIQSWGGKKAA